MDVSWPAFQELELWQVKNRAFVTGEKVVGHRIDHLVTAIDARMALRFKNPKEKQQEYIDDYLDAIVVKTDRTAGQKEQDQRNSNQAFFEAVKHHGRRS